MRASCPRVVPGAAEAKLRAAHLGETIEDKRGPGLRFPPPLLVLVLIGQATWLMPGYPCRSPSRSPVRPAPDRTVAGHRVTNTRLACAFQFPAREDAGRTLATDNGDPSIGSFRLQSQSHLPGLLYRHARGWIDYQQLVGAWRNASAGLPAAATGDKS